MENLGSTSGSILNGNMVSVQYRDGSEKCHSWYMSSLGYIPLLLLFISDV
jgi:hypothetical protein